MQSLPASVGPYRIIRLLGEGGMGIVYEAEQDQPRRRVALKVIRAPWASPELLRRFEQESQSLGRLQHSGIAHIYEAGSAGTGFGAQPYFAMELIHGKSLVEYANEHNLSVRKRLALMIQVCEAVQHAHQRGIIHRDLKPGNILVDETGKAKILDFGLARATDLDAQVTRQTDIGQVLGTLAYMSPEQVQADPLAVDTRTDVYALGVILYELLAGKMPYALSRQLHEAVRIIQEVDPAPLSTVNRTYRGDIETIVAKALEKDKDRRYASAADLATDIRLYLKHQPITAKPPSTIYQLQKFTRRHRVLVSSAAAVVTALVIGVVTSSWQAVQARRAEKKAQQQSEIAHAVNDFLQNDLLAQASAYNQSKADPDLKVRTALDRAADKIQGKFEKQPEVEAAIRETIGKTYGELGLYPEELKQFELALELSRKALGADNPKTLEIMAGLGKALEDQGKFAEAEKQFVEAVERDRRVSGPDNPQTLRAMHLLAMDFADEGKYAEAEELLSNTFETQRRVLGSENLDTLKSMGDLATVYINKKKYAQAEELLNQTLQIQNRVFGSEHPETLASMNNLAFDYLAQGKHAQAEDLFNRVMEIQRRVLGPSHPSTVKSMINLADTYSGQGNHVEAEAVYRRAVEASPENPLALNDLAWLLLTADDQSRRRPEEALQLSRRAVKVAPEDANNYNTLGLAAVRNSRWDEAIAALTKSAQMHENSDPTDFFLLAMAYQGRGDRNEAARLFGRAVDLASKDAENQPDWRMFWIEAAKALGKRAPMSLLPKRESS